MNWLIQKGEVYDGTGAPARRADVLVRDGVIAQIAPGIQAADAQTVDASGCAVTPGFIDSHRHCDFAALTDEAFGKAELAQGITTVVGGNCGLSAVPLRQAAAAAEAFVAPCLGPATATRYDSASAYMQALSHQPLRLHMGMLAGLGAIRVAVKGFAKSPFSRQEMDAATGLVREGLDAGMLGLSMGVMYPPECYNTDDEYVSLLRAASPYGRPVCCHIRGEGDSLVSSVRETIDWGRRAGMPVHISHFKCTGLKNWRDGIFRAIDVIEQARQSGQDVTVDVYPYAAGATTLLSLLPPSVLDEDNDRLWDKLGTSAGVEEVRTALSHSHPGWDDMIASIGWKRIKISSGIPGEAFDCVNHDLEEIAEGLGLNGPVEAMCALLHRTRGNVGVVLESMDPQDVDDVARLPYSFFISDALYGEGASHPRRWGAFSRVIRDLVMDRGVLSLPEAIRKMTSLPAMRLGIANRGVLKQGMQADINIFDPAMVADRATYANPAQHSTGMKLILVDGQPVWNSNGEVASLCAGRAIRASR